MKGPIARPTSTSEAVEEDTRPPRAFVPGSTEIVEAEPVFEAEEDAEITALPVPRRMGWLGKLVWGTGSVLVSLGLGLMADRLIRDLYTRYEWLGWAGVVVLAIFVLALLAVAIREIWAVRRLRQLDHLRKAAADVLVSDKRHDGQKIISELSALYGARPDLARVRDSLDTNVREMFDGAEMVRLAERTLMAQLDARAKTLTAASARRVALVTAVSPRALVDIAFVVYESVRLAGAIAALYGARPGFFGFWRLTGAVLSHLAVTGGLVLTDGLVEQLVGQGLAGKLSQRLGEGVVNGLMTVRVGIAAMRVVRPLPFETLPQPMVRDFIPDLANVTQTRRRA
jgi:putative membrane protein